MTNKKRVLALAWLLLAVPMAACVASPPADDDDDGGTSGGTTSGGLTSTGASMDDDGSSTSSGSSSEFCYDLDCNGDVTGLKCFETQDAYCDSLCAESNCLAPPMCEAECL